MVKSLMEESHYTYQEFQGEAEDWNALVLRYPDAGLLQTWEFGTAKTQNGSWQVERGLIMANRSVSGAVQTIIRTVPFTGAGIAWVNRGPIGSFENVGAALNAIRYHFNVSRGFYLRVAPSFIETDALASICREGGLKRTSIEGWASSMIDLHDPNDLIRANLHSKWRNALVRAEHAELDISIGSDQETFETFLRGHAAHLSARGPSGGLDTEFLQSLQELLPVERKLLCVTAMKDGRYLGGAAFARYGKTGEYLAGHNTDAGRKENSGQLVLWSALCQLKSDGMTRLDLGGMDEHLTPAGIFRFKNRMGGKPYRLACEMEGEAPGLINKAIRWRVRHGRSLYGHDVGAASTN